MAENAQIYGGRWRVIGEVGRGGQGTVFEVEDTSNPNKEDEWVERLKTVLREATSPAFYQDSESACRGLTQLIGRISDTVMGPRFVLKKLLPPNEAVNTDTALDRMKTEIETMRQVKHPSLIDILDEGDDHSWFVMEFFSNGTLAEALGLFTNQVLRSLKALRPVVEAVSLLHQAGIVHRDVKLENMFVGNAGGLVLGDCGLAFLRDGHDRVTETYENVGSRDWMPGWAMGQRLSEVRPNYDVFSFGKVLWAMVAGKPILPLWYHREQGFNLAMMFPDDESISFVQALLDKTVVERPDDCLTDATELLAEIDWTIEALAKQVRIVNGDLLLNCLVCGNGQYLQIADRNHVGQYNFGLAVIGQPKFKIFVCTNCGHVQLFYSLDGLSMSAWQQ